MQSFRESDQSARPESSIKLAVPVELAIVAGTLPLLTLVISARFIGEGLSELGKASEELFRGDRLPVRPLLQKTSAEKDI